MIPLALIMAMLGWCDLPPRPAAVRPCPVRALSNRERRRISGNWMREHYGIENF